MRLRLGRCPQSRSVDGAGEGWGEGEATLETLVRLRIADELNDTGTVRWAIQRRDTRTTQRVRFAT